MALLHAEGHSGGGFIAFAEEVLLHGALDTLKLIPLLFLTYLLMEFIEHRAAGKVLSLTQSAGKLGPAIGSLLGALPQCGFSAAAANLYTARVVTTGTLIAVFLSTSDEMIPILLGGSVAPKTVFTIVLYKAVVAMLIGFAVDGVRKLFGHKREEINIDEICERDGCHCERGIIYSAVHHTLTITAFVFLTSLLIGSLVYFVGEEQIGVIVNFIPFASHLLSALVGLIPNCAASVALSSLYVDGIITAGAMISGLFSGAGVGLIVLLRVNKNLRENLAVIAVILASGFVFGILFDLLALVF